MTLATQLATEVSSFGGLGVTSMESTQFNNEGFSFPLAERALAHITHLI